MQVVRCGGNRAFYPCISSFRLLHRIRGQSQRDCNLRNLRRPETNRVSADVVGRVESLRYGKRDRLIYCRLKRSYSEVFDRRRERQRTMFAPLHLRWSDSLARRREID